MDELRCFVAMPLERQDCDNVFDKLVVTTLKHLKIKPIRIDRIEHNDDIDKRIISEIKSCDFEVGWI
jgi:hypothetical protein